MSTFQYVTRQFSSPFAEQSIKQNQSPSVKANNASFISVLTKLYNQTMQMK